MAYYKICPKCGCALDPGEHCDCDEIKNAAHDGANIIDSTQTRKNVDNLFYHSERKNVNRGYAI